MSETHTERVERMANVGPGGWQFFDADMVALRAVLSERRDLLAALKLAEEAMTNAYDVEYRADPKSYAGIALMTARALIARCEGTAPKGSDEGQG